MDIVFAVFVDFDVIAFPIGRRSGLEHTSIDLVDFFFELADSIFYRLLLFDFRFLGWESWMISWSTFGIVSPLIVPFLFCLKLIADSGRPVPVLGNNVFGRLKGFGIYFFCHVKLQFIISRLSIIIDIVYVML